MRVGCPHCHAAYNIDDRRVPAKGLNVRCPKCRDTFPVRPAAAPGARRRSLRTASGCRSPRPPLRSQAQFPSRRPRVGPVPLPGPAVPPLSRGATPPASVPLPAPRVGSGGVPLPPPLPSTSAGHAGPVAPAAQADDPFGPDVPDATADVVEASPEGAALGFGEFDLGDGASPAAEPGSPSLDDTDPFAPAPGAGPFGAAPAPPSIPDPFAASRYAAPLASPPPLRHPRPRAPAPVPAPPKGGEDLEMLFGEAQGPRGGVPGVESADREASARRAAARLTREGVAARPRARGLFVAAGALAIVLAVGAGAGFTRYGTFFAGALRGRDAARTAALLAKARAALAKGDYASERAALDLAAQAVAADPEAREAAALHALAVAALEVRHGAPPAALEQARRAADRLGERDATDVAALASRLAVTLSAGGGATAPQEAALEHAASNAGKDAEVTALLARAALARGDAARAADRFGALDALEPNGARAPHGKALAAAARGDAAGRAGGVRGRARARRGVTSRRGSGWLSSRRPRATRSRSRRSLRRCSRRRRRRGSVPQSGRARSRSGRRCSPGPPRAPRRRTAPGRRRPPPIRAAPTLAWRSRATGSRTATRRAPWQRPSRSPRRRRRIPRSRRSGCARSRARGARSTPCRSRIARSPPRRRTPHLSLAKAGALAGAGRIEDAVALYRGVAEKSPSAWEPRLALGRIALTRRQLDVAAAELGVAVERAPRVAAVHAAVGELRAARGDPVGAEGAYRQALAVDPECAAAETGLARIALARGDAAAARARLERALALDPRDADGHVAYGALLWAAGDLAGAEKALESAVELQPRSAAALVRLGAVKLERGDVDGAVQRLTSAVAEAPQTRRGAAVARSRAPREGRDPGGAVEAPPRGRARPRDRGPPPPPRRRARAGERARGGARGVPRRREGRPAAGRASRAASALLFAANGRCDAAVPAYEKAIAVAPRLARLRVALGDCQLRIGKAEDAAKAFRDVLRADPNAVPVLYRLGRALHEAEGERAALPWYERAAREEKDNPMPHYYLGYLYKERGEKRRARSRRSRRSSR